MARPIMIQGTMSNAGKSLLAAGLCRVFHQDGYRVAPFKSQNMALNSYITAEGLEMGRAQVLQAQAAGIEPSVRMNPILLKPTTETGSQVIVNGRVLGNFSARDYFAKKQSLVPQIMEAYESLAAENDIIVLEGAGSPAEINLKQDDIVNMGIAKLAQAPVLLVGDIDRGGVFAALAGTLLLLEPEERARVKGLVINKFRGDRRILEPGLRQIEQITGCPVTGVLPYLTLDLEDEDSLSGKLESTASDAPIQVAVIRLPRLSNFTDLDALAACPGVGVRYVRSLNQLGHPDLVVLPGTKSTMADLRWLRQSGLEAAILRLAEQGVPVLGICGGYQMMGQTLSDPVGAEEAPGTCLRGMGLLPVETVFSREKARTQARGRFAQQEGRFAAFSGREVQGYEIHMGRSRHLEPCRPLVHLEENGTLREDGAVWKNAAGCYLHGLLDTPQALRGLLELLCAPRGIDPDKLEIPDPQQRREWELDRLAQAVRENLDMEQVYRILEQGCNG